MNVLREEILNGKFPDGRLPSKLSLIEHFQVSQQTIDIVLKRLRNEGLIYGVRGTGIFINQKIESVSNLTHRLVLMLLPIYQPYEGEPYDSLRQEALKRCLLPINIKLPHREEMQSLQEQATINQMLSAPIHGMLYDGSDYMYHSFLKQCRNLRSVGLILINSIEPPLGSTVLLDFKTGAFRLAKHLYQKSAKKVLVFCSYISPETPKDPAYWKRHISTNFLTGASMAAQEGGFPKPDLMFQENKEYITDEEMLRIARNYDTVICNTDTLAYSLIKKANSLGIRVPEDLMVSGSYNTIWSSKLDLKITTLTQNPLDLSRKAFEILEAGGIHHELVVPEIIERESTIRESRNTAPHQIKIQQETVRITI